MIICRTKLLAVIASSLLASSANAIILDISSVGDSGMSFNGDGTLDFFGNASGYVFEVNDTDGGVGDAAGLFGSISGMWTIDPWSGNTTTLSGGPGTLSIMDGSGEMLTADLDFKMIGTVLSGGVINGSSNLTNFAYGGTNGDLGLLAAATSATLAMSFELAGGPSDLTLGYLASTALDSTFSGDLVTPPENVPDGGTTAALLGLGCLALVGLSRGFRKREEVSHAA